MTQFNTAMMKFFISLLPITVSLRLRSFNDFGPCVNPLLNQPPVTDKLLDRMYDHNLHGKTKCIVSEEAFDVSKLNLLGLITEEQALQARISQGNPDQWRCMFEKLAAGAEPVEILVLGGSIAAGHKCYGGGRAGMLCAWPARFEDHLRRLFPAGKLSVDNAAMGGTTTLSLLSSLPMLLGKGRRAQGKAGPDLIILDNLLNEMQASLSANESAIHMEVFTKYVRTLSPESSLLYLEIARIGEQNPYMSTIDVQAGRQMVAVHHNIPVVSAVEIQKSSDRFWLGPAHPNAITHGFVADLLYISFLHDIKRNNICQSSQLPCTFQLPEVTGTVFPNDTLAAVPVCYDLKSSYIREWSQGITQDGNWELCEDRPQKLGWLAARTTDDKMPAEITFKVQFGKYPTLTLNVLRSYQSLGRVELEIGGSKMVFDALYEADHPHVSQSEPIIFKRDLRERGRWDPGFQCNKGTGCYLPKTIEPETEHDLTLRLLVDPTREVNKFKVLEIASC